MTPRPPLDLALALDGAGWHPAAWREPRADRGTARRPVLDRSGPGGRARPARLRHDRGLPRPAVGPVRRSGRPDRPSARPARRRAHRRSCRPAHHTHRSRPVDHRRAHRALPHLQGHRDAGLCQRGAGRGGLRVRAGSGGTEAALFGRRQIPGITVADLDRPEVVALITELFDEAADYVEVVRRLWDSWEDDAEIRDVATGRFLDRDKLHYIDFEGRWFSVRGPSIVPRPPQGQPLVTVLGHGTVPYRLGARQADVVYVTPRDADDARRIVGEIRAEQDAAGRGDETVHVFADLVVHLADSAAQAADNRARLDERAGGPQASDAHIVAGTPGELADLLLDWQSVGLSGFRLRPAAIPHDLEGITRGLVGELQSRGAFRTAYEAATLRGLLGLARPANRYATANSTAAV